MAAKAYSVMFCGLLASTFAHEFRAKDLVPVRRVEGQLLKQRVKRDSFATPMMVIQVVKDILVFENSTADAAVAIEVSSKVFVFLSGTTASGIIIDKANHKGAYISCGLWNSTHQTLGEFLKSLNHPIEELICHPGSLIFDIHHVPEYILKAITDIVVNLVICIDGKLERDLTMALKLVISIVDNILILLNGRLKGLLRLIGKSIIRVQYDLGGLLCVLEALDFVIGRVAVDLTKRKLDVEKILGAAHGLDALTSLFLQLGEKLTSSDLVKDLRYVENLFLLIAKLGGNISIGITGVCKVSGNILAFVNKHAPLYVFINQLVEYLYYSAQYIDYDLTGDYKKAFGDLLHAIEKVSGKNELIGLKDIIKDLIKEKLVVDRCKISAVNEKLLNGFLKAKNRLLILVIEILVILDNVCPLAISIPYLLLVLICKLDTPCGIEQVKGMGINIKLNVAIITGGVLNYILSTVKKLKSVLDKELYDALNELPIFKVVLKALDKDVEAVFHERLTLRKLLTSNGVVKLLIKGLIQIVVNHSMGVSKSICDQSKTILESVAGFKAYINIDINKVAVDSVRG